MTDDDIRVAIADRLGMGHQRGRAAWTNKLLAERAPPLCCIAVMQTPGPNFGKPVLCTVEDGFTNAELADFLEMIADMLRNTP